MKNPPHIPQRVVNYTLATERFGLMADRMVSWLQADDPIADAVMESTRGWSQAKLFRTVATCIRDQHEPPAELAALIGQVNSIPVWVDFDRLDRGASFFMSTHALGGLVLGARSLILGYAAPAGNKPLVMSGRLTRGVNRRLAETSKFVNDVSRPGGMRPGGAGVVAAVQVRLIHARVRQMIRDRSTWDPEWGEPINQHDMAATVLLFSLAMLEGLETLGLNPTEHEAEDYIALWRYIGYLLGVDTELLAASRAEAERLYQYIDLTQGPPDDDARALTRVFLNAPAEQPSDEDHASAARPNVAVGYALARRLLGPELADQLDIPTTNLALILPVLKPIVARLNGLRKLPGSRRRAAEQGMRYWEWVLENQPSGAIELTLPTSLISRASA